MLAALMKDPAGRGLRASGSGAAATISLAYADLVRVLAGPETLEGLLASGAATISGDAAAARGALACFDVAGLRA